MIVRCGRCQVELEVAGPGEFVCPACGTRNAVRGAPRAPYDLSSLQVPGGAPSGDAPPDDGSVKWGSCPDCSWRFAMGDVERVTCPNCRAELTATPQGLARAG